LTTRSVRWGALALGLMLLSACATGRAVRSGDAAVKRGDWDTAVAFYRDALGREPGRIDVKVSLERAMRMAADAHLKRARDLEAQDQLAGAAAEYRLAGDLDPSYTLALSKANEIDRKIRDQIEASRPKPNIDLLRQQAAQSSVIPKLDPRVRLPGLKFVNASVKDILTFIGQSTGINVTYDQGLDSAIGRPYSIDATDISAEEALNQVLTANTLTYKIVNSKTIFVYADNTTNRQKYEDQYVQVFYLSHAEVTDLVTVLNQILTQVPGVRPQVTPNKTANALTVKATAPVLAVISNIITANDKPRAEVMIDVEILEVDRTRLMQRGLDLSQWALGLTFSPELSPPNAATTAGAFPTQPPPFNLNTLSQGVSAQDFFVTAPTALIRLLESDQRTKLLARPQLRGREGSTLTLNLGSSVPVAQGSVGQAAAGGIATVPQINYTYRSIGVNLTITPRVTYQDEIILDPITVDDSALGQNVDVAGQSLPSFVQRTANVSMRLRDGESNLLAGLVKETDTKTNTSLPGVLHIPILRSIFGNQNNSLDQSDVVMIVTPHIVRGHDLTANDLKPMYVGTGQNFGGNGMPQLISPDVPLPATAQPPGQTAPAAGGAPPGATPPGTNPRAVGVVPVQPVTSAVPPPQILPAQVVVTPPGTEFETTGGPYTVPLMISGISQVGSATLTVSYNPAVLRAVAVTQGTFMQQGGVATSFAPRIDATTGRVDIAIARTGDTSGASGTGLLAAISFQAVAAGSSQVTVSGVAMTATGQPITLQMVPATVTVK
jgi:general secretion pathway protein D